jgi:hypothetical protein
MASDRCRFSRHGSPTFAQKFRAYFVPSVVYGLAPMGEVTTGVSLASLVGRRLKSGLKRARLMLYRFPHEGVTWVLPFQPRSYIHSQDPKTAHSIDESIPLFLRPTVVL